MGLLTGILTLPLAPVRGVMWIAEQIEAEADREMNDPAVIRRKIDESERAFEDGDIDEAERDARQEELLGRLIDRGGGGRSG
ncbi:putative gas vesicle synthesis protein [Pseudonocardia sp. Ae168_Ps1]|uniref:gas vesicle protein GvpG n=1 Tax=unclassified Pseudonocardia TaxID=2619320 RepID=UPI00094B1DB9|nr:MULTISPECIES: gas vesicle protein GvpG [unclassified Pseudonocardia]OLL71154.1 putative gas vesicle synthesis protein [Pseudonocardia sp. Ae168_Ps1]OLL77297.1 putative gas vesicle synthesis protein [Pseudonocardia sp. Ae150A_Ps1]OLL88593.1 putative gas vesicle synthesis protein [Pseudonocardia sp. Ae263_Ps1]OLL91386.1 putative gas vesicle synthesis protein [Pseudonocardia sp. Ae356_Ps1]